MRLALLDGSTGALPAAAQPRTRRPRAAQAPRRCQYAQREASPRRRRGSGGGPHCHAGQAGAAAAVRAHWGRPARPGPETRPPRHLGTKTDAPAAEAAGAPVGCAARRCPPIRSRRPPRRPVILRRQSRRRHCRRQRHAPAASARAPPTLPSRSLTRGLRRGQCEAKRSRPTRRRSAERTRGKRRARVKFRALSG